jgi:hypothetical protein
MRATGHTLALAEKPGRKTWKCYVIIAPADPANPGNGKTKCFGVRRSRADAEQVAGSIPFAVVEKHFAD